MISQLSSGAISDIGASPQYEESDETIQARGMSGGRVWMLSPFEAATVWDPGRLTLLGIQVAWFPNVVGRPLLATRIEHIQALLVWGHERPWIMCVWKGCPWDPLASGVMGD